MTGLRFTAHSLERGLERMMKIKPPYSKEQMDNIEKLMAMSMEHSTITDKWRIPSFNIELVVVDNIVITVMFPNETNLMNKKVTQYEKENQSKVRKTFYKMDNKDLK